MNTHRISYMNSVQRNFEPTGVLIMPFNFLTEAEGTSADEAIEELRRIDWANELLSVIEHNGGVSFDNTSFLFELRF